MDALIYTTICLISAPNGSVEQIAAESLLLLHACAQAAAIAATLLLLILLLTVHKPIVPAGLVDSHGAACKATAVNDPAAHSITQVTRKTVEARAQHAACRHSALHP